MMHAGRAIRNLRAFIRNDKGNFALFAAATVPLFIAVASFAVDTTNAFSMKSRLQNAADATALATSSRLAKGELLQADAEAYAEKFFEGMVAEDGAAYSGFAATPVIDVTPVTDAKGRKSWEVRIDVTGSQDLTPMASLLGQDKLAIGVHGVSESVEPMQNAFSMMLVLDRSGSMAWDSGQTTVIEVEKECKRKRKRNCSGTTTEEVSLTKLQVLQAAVHTLLSNIEESDGEDKYARLGAVAYNFETTDNDKQPMGWDKSDVGDFADDLTANNGTNPLYAMTWAYGELTNLTEEQEHEAKNGNDEPSKFIIFMTDGETDTGNNMMDAWYDKQTKQVCTDAKDAGITIFSVAFQAPDAGKALLSFCSSGPQFYYDANSAAELVKAFDNIGSQAAGLLVRLTQ